MARYGKKASETVGEAMHELKKGTLRSGRSGARVRSRKQAIAIGLSEARREGGKVPARSKSASGAGRRRATKKTGGRSRAKTRGTGSAARKTAGGARR